jgi:hypothetical protein
LITRLAAKQALQNTPHLAVFKRLLQRPELLNNSDEEISPPAGKMARGNEAKF